MISPYFRKQLNKAIRKMDAHKGALTIQLAQRSLAEIKLNGNQFGGLKRYLQIKRTNPK